jgi:hypothetical protein
VRTGSGKDRILVSRIGLELYCYAPGREDTLGGTLGCMDSTKEATQLNRGEKNIKKTRGE